MLDRLTHMLAADVVTWNPSPSGVPGYGTFRTFVNWGGSVALLACLAALIIGGARWALGSGSSNIEAAAGGRRMVVAAVAGAFVIGGAQILINTFFHQG